MSETTGKIEQHAFDSIISGRCGAPRDTVAVNAQFGVDVSLVDLPGGMAMALTSDPLSLVPSLGLAQSAWLSVHLLANDMATTGVAPMYAQMVLNLPATFSRHDFKTYWNHIHTYCTNIGVAITGGHTGFVEQQHSTIAGGGTFITVAPKNRLLVSKYARSGDSILVTKGAALCASAILAMSFPQTVANKAGREVQQQAAEAFWQTTSLTDALTAVEEEGAVTAMHDVTEGGVLGAIYELAAASGNGAVVYNNQLPVHHTQQAVCNIFDLDPRYCVGAGSMIITCKPGREAGIIHRLAAKGITCTAVGTVTEKEQGIIVVDGDQRQPLKYIEQDPYWAAFFKAYQQQWK